MNRDNFIKFIPKPKNSDVILYDTTLADLIDVDVLQEYNKLYPVFIKKKEEYTELKNKMDEYEKTINNIYLYKRNWSEEEYLQSLQNDKKTYATLYGEIKKIENNISMLQRNLNSINDKIKIQNAKENKKIEEKKDNIDKNIEKNKENLLNLKNYLDAYKLSLKQIDEQIQDNQEEFELLEKMQNKLDAGECKCELCGRTIKSVGEDSLLYQRLCKNAEKNKNNLEKLLFQKEKIELNVSYYESEIEKVKSNLKNDIEFKKENHNFYQKKSLEVLKLEALRDEILNNINNYQKQLDSNSKTKTKQFMQLKDNIEKYELSLNNLRKVKEIKAQTDEYIEEYRKKKEELKSIFSNIENYVKYIDIYYKILEQKASEYCGTDFKFKFHRIENYKLIPILEIQYQGIEYSKLDNETRQTVDTIIVEKFSIYF